jgi:hypothetical protein
MGSQQTEPWGCTERLMYARITPEAYMNSCNHNKQGTVSILQYTKHLGTTMNGFPLLPLLHLGR